MKVRVTAAEIEVSKHLHLEVLQAFGRSRLCPVSLAVAKQLNITQLSGERFISTGAHGTVTLVNNDEYRTLTGNIPGVKRFVKVFDQWALSRFRGKAPRGFSFEMENPQNDANTSS